MTIIIDFQTHFKGYNENILNNYDFPTYICPKCGAKHSFIRHGSYERHLAYLSDGVPTWKRMRILRLLCTSCGSTHAILPCDIVPYVLYSYGFILQVLGEHFLDHDSIPTLANKYAISHQVLYAFVNLFLYFIRAAYLLLNSLAIVKLALSPIPILYSIIVTTQVDHFYKLFFTAYRWLYLMKKFHNQIPCPVFIGTS